MNPSPDRTPRDDDTEFDQLLSQALDGVLDGEEFSRLQEQLKANPPRGNDSSTRCCWTRIWLRSSRRSRWAAWWMRCRRRAGQVPCLPRQEEVTADGLAAVPMCVGPRPCWCRPCWEEP